MLAMNSLTGWDVLAVPVLILVVILVAYHVAIWLGLTVGIGVAAVKYAKQIHREEKPPVLVCVFWGLVAFAFLCWLMAQAA